MKSMLALFLLAGFSLHSECQTWPKSVRLEWTVRQSTDGKAGIGYHVYTLTCVNALCTLYVVNLNQCDEGRQAAFFPSAEYWDNTPAPGGSLLDVSFPRDGTVELEIRGWSYGQTTTTMKIGYRRTNPRMAAVVTSFSGAVVKNSEITKKIISWQLEPIVGKAALTRVPVNCPNILIPTMVAD